jgi:hypothetical protein
MMVAVDQAGKQDVTAEVEDDVGGPRQFGGRTDALDEPVSCEQARIAKFASLAIHRYEDVGILCE